MTYVEAAIAILKASRKPMTSADITKAALGKGFIQPRGKTPAATMSAALYTFVRDADEPPIQREFQDGPTRAARNSVRWRYVG